MAGFESMREIESHEECDALVEAIERVTQDRIALSCFDGTFEMDANTFSLSFTMTDDHFEIRSIDVHGNHGLGSDILDAIHTFADERGLEVYASKVRSTARGFWEKMGYQEAESDGEYYRVD